MTTQSSLPSPKGKSDLEVRLEEAAADQVVARVGQADMSIGELARARRKQEERGPLKASFFPCLVWGNNLTATPLSDNLFH